jgi:hypothetical protein
VKAGWNDASLDAFRLTGDPLADRAVASLLQGWEDPASHEANLKALQQAFGGLRQLALNQDFNPLPETGPDSGPELGMMLASCATPPAWADLGKIERAEQLFRAGGVVSGIVFFCASLPEVYVVPDISTVLRATGNLEKLTDQRIRATSAMILSVLLPGGLRKAQGAGRPKVMKARFIHAVMRHLFLRASPETLLADGGPALVAPLADAVRSENVFRQALAHGWDPANAGVPCNQEEQAYTLLTFGFVYLRALRRLGLGYAPADEEAYLHLWNVVGHMMGIDSGLMAHTMDEAAALFDRLQQRARAKRLTEDPRPALGEALVASIEKSIPRAVLKPAAALLVRYLSSDTTARELALDKRYSTAARWLFGAGMGTIRLADALVRQVRPKFSLVRFVLRIAGYRLVHTVLTDSRNPIDLPETTRHEVNLMLAEWSSDEHAPRWLNVFEDYFTTKGNWSESIGV